jgi:hypothetical protein
MLYAMYEKKTFFQNTEKSLWRDIFYERFYSLKIL